MPPRGATPLASIVVAARSMLNLWLASLLQVPIGLVLYGQGLCV